MDRSWQEHTLLVMLSHQSWLKEQCQNAVFWLSLRRVNVVSRCFLILSGLIYMASS